MHTIIDTAPSCSTFSFLKHFTNNLNELAPYSAIQVYVHMSYSKPTTQAKGLSSHLLGQEGHNALTTEPKG